MIDLAALADAYSGGAISPPDILAACLARIDAHADLNAVVHRDPRAGSDAAASLARWRSGAPLSPIDGAPVVVKANCAVAGLPWTAALAGLSERVATQDSAVVAALRNAGAVIVGVANMHEAALGATTDSPVYGRAYNPLRAGYTPGGSSGGSAAAVAAGLCAGAIGTDTMGSVRIPSAYCGVFGLKPSFGRISRRGVTPLSLTLDHVGVHAASTAGLSALLDAIGGFDPEDAYAQAYPIEPARQPQSLSLAVVRTGVNVAPGVAAAFDSAIAALRADGHTISELDWTDYDLPRLRRRGLLICEAEFEAFVRPELDASPKLSDALASMLAFGASQPPAKLAEAYDAVAQARHRACQAFERFDVLLLPGAAQVAFPHDHAAPANQADLTVFANFAGLPAGVAPIGVAEEGLPASLQAWARPGREADVLAVLARVEALDLTGTAARAFP